MKNTNYLEAFRKNKNYNPLQGILYSYDLQAGSYINHYESNIKSPCLDEEGCVSLSFANLLAKRAKNLAAFINASQIGGGKSFSLLEAGCGEATFLLELIRHLPSNTSITGFDIAPSRVKYAQDFLSKMNAKASLYVASMDAIPFADNSFDVVITHHALEPNTLGAHKLISELYRVCSKLLVMIEPSFKMGNAATKQNILKHKYLQNLPASVGKLGLNLCEKRLFYPTHEHNNSALFALKKDAFTAKSLLICPQCKQELEYKNAQNFCKNCHLVYPILGKTQLLRPQDGVFFSAFDK